MICKKESAGTSDCGTAETNNAAKFISLCARFKAALIRYGAIRANADGCGHE